MGPRIIPGLTPYKSGVKAGVSWAHWMILHHEEFVYSFRRPLYYHHLPPFDLDCSFSCGWVAWRSGWLVNPLTGTRDWPGWGNSSSAWARSRHIGLASVRAGDFITYGPGGDEHMVFVIEGGRDPLVMSDGRQGAPEYGRNSQMVHLGVPTYLRVNTAARHPVYAG